jgi:hypothetical protein
LETPQANPKTGSIFEAPAKIAHSKNRPPLGPFMDRLQKYIANPVPSEPKINPNQGIQPAGSVVCMVGHLAPVRPFRSNLPARSVARGSRDAQHRCFKIERCRETPQWGRQPVRFCGGAGPVTTIPQSGTSGSKVTATPGPMHPLCLLRKSYAHRRLWSWSPFR